MRTVDEVAEEGGAEVTAGVETGQDEVWMVRVAVFFGTDTFLDTRAACVRRRLFAKVLWLKFRAQGTAG